jgi:16S rRNA C1402 N4-methylase RsmH
MKIRTKQALTMVIQAGEVVNVTEEQYQSIQQFVEIVKENNLKEVVKEVVEQNNEKEVAEKVVKKASRRVKKTEKVKE